MKPYKNGAPIKQFVVTNCKQGATRLYSDQNSEKRILTPIDISKESDFDADLKYISFIKFSYTHQKLHA
jgi:hypothetical protein